jgi:hypothetical protein
MPVFLAGQQAAEVVLQVTDLYADDHGFAPCAELG